MRKPYVAKFNRIEVVNLVAKLDAEDTRTSDVVSEIGCSKSHIFNIRQHPEYRDLYNLHRTAYIQQKHREVQ